MRLNTMPTNTLDVQIRWMQRTDLLRVLDIERQNFPHGWRWSENDFLDCLRQRNCIGMVADDRLGVVGFLVYELVADRLEVLNFAVDPAAQRRRVGTRMLDRLVDKLHQHNRHTIRLLVRETNAGAVRFFAANGFRAELVRTPYEDCEDDGYRMEFRLEGT